MNSDPVIWWLSYNEQDCIGESLPKQFPKYLRDEYASMKGRPTRGRLWVAKRFDVYKITPPENTAIYRRCATSGGIVMERSDIALLDRYPGIITDLDQKRVA